MKSKSEDINGITIIPSLLPDCLKHINGNGCKVMIVDPDSEVQQIVKSALKHYSYKGNYFDILGASNLKKASELCIHDSNFILILINRIEFDEHELYQFIRFLRDKLNNSFCRIVFKDELVLYESLTNKFRLNGVNDYRSEFEDVRGNMISYLREVFISFEKSSKETYDTAYSVSKHLLNENKLKRNEAIQKKGLSHEKTYSILAHDLRGPIGSIKTLMEVLTTEPELLDNETTQELLLHVKNTAGSIHEMLENFMFWVRVHRKDIHFSPMKIDLSQAVKKTILLLNSTAYYKKIKLHSKIQTEIKVFADEYMLNTVLRNLILNAIKFTKEGGEVSIHANSNSENEVEITVLDNGIGISEHHLSKIFDEETYFSKSGTANETGMGFGLLLSKDFIENNGGQLLVISNVDKGSSFSFTIPKWKTMTAN